MTTPKSSPLRQRPVSRSDLRARSNLETLLLAYCYGKAVAGAKVSIRDLATLPGPSGREVGTSAALAAVRDLTDDGLLFLPGLDRAGIDQELTVIAPGQQPKVVQTNTGATVVARKPPPPWSTGEKAFGLWLPRNLDPVLADEVRRAHLELNAFHQKHHGKAWPVDQQHRLTVRKVHALRAWSKHSPRNRAVAEALAKSEAALADISRQLETWQAKQAAA